MSGQNPLSSSSGANQDGEEEDFPTLTADDIEEVHDASDDQEDVPMDSDEDQENLQQGDQQDDDDVDADDDDNDGDDRLIIQDSSIAAFFEHKGQSVFTVKLHPSYPNPPLAISGGFDETSFIWNADDGKVVQELLPKHKDSVTMVGWNVDGTLVASGGMDGMINVWRKADETWKKWEHVQTLEGGDEVQFITWHPKGNVLVAGYGDATIWMWQLPKGEVMQVFSGHEDVVTAGSFTPDGKKLLTTSTDGSLIIYDPRQPIGLSKLSTHDSRFRCDGGFVSLAVSPDGKLAAVGSVSGETRVVSITGVDQGGGLAVVCALKSHRAGESVEGLSFIDLLGLGHAQTAGAGHLVTIATDGKAIVWDLTTQKARVECVHHDQEGDATGDGGALTTIVTHNSGPLFTTASSGGTLMTWDARTGKSIARHEGFTDGVLDADVKSDGQGGWRLVGAGDEGVALVFKC